MDKISYLVEVIKGNFLIGSGNEEYNNKYCFHVYFDTSHPIFESGYLFNSKEEAFNHFLKFHIKNINDWDIKKYDNEIVVTHK